MLESEMLAKWRHGKLTVMEEQERRGRVLACQDMQALALGSIRAFYGTDE